MAATDFDQEIKQLKATMSTIGQVLDLDEMRREIADLSEQVAAPDLWDDQEKAQKVTSLLSHRQGELRRITTLRERLGEDVASAHLVIDGTSAVLVRGNELIDVVNRYQGQGVLNLLPMDGVIEELDTAVQMFDDGDTDGAVVSVADG